MISYFRSLSELYLTPSTDDRFLSDVGLLDEKRLTYLWKNRGRIVSDCLYVSTCLVGKSNVVKFLPVKLC